MSEKKYNRVNRSASHQVLGWSAGLLMLIGPVVRAQTPSHSELKPLRFSEWLKSSLQLRPTLVLKRIQRDIAAEGVTQARSQFLPQVSIEGGIQLRNTTPLEQYQFRSQSPLVPFWRVKLSESLWDNGVSFTQWKVAGLKAERAEIEFEIERSAVVYELMVEFLDFWLEREQLALQKKTMERAISESKRVILAYQQGVRPRVDALRMESEGAQLELRLLQLSEQLKLREKNVLGRLNPGLISLAENSVQSQYFLDLVPLETFLKSVQTSVHHHIAAQIGRFEQSTLSKKMELARKQSQEEASLGSRRIWPELNISAEAGVQGDFSQVSEPYYGASVGLKMSVWDWFGSWSQRKVSTLLVEQAEMQIRKEQDDWMRGLNDAMSLVERKKQETKIAERWVKIEQELYTVGLSEFNNGRLSSQDLLVVLRGYAQSQQSKLSAQVEELKANLALCAHWGVLKEEWFEHF